MPVPQRPERFEAQNPAISGCKLGWLSCTCFACSMGVNKSTLGKKDPTGCAVRTATGDTSGGTSLPQVAKVAKDKYGVVMDVRTGINYATPYQLAQALKAGRACEVQGNSSALLNTIFRSTGTGVNHAVLANDARGWQGDYPEEVLVYDSAADGRRAGWGTAAKGPDWWPWNILLRFAAALKPWGDRDPRILGPGKVYVGIFPDTEPHYHATFGGVKTTPWPDLMTIDPPGAAQLQNVRRGPSTAHPIAKTLKVGTPFTAWQKAKGQLLAGSDVWYGDHDGVLWVHSSGVRT